MSRPNCEQIADQEDHADMHRPPLSLVSQPQGFRDSAPCLHHGWGQSDGQRNRFHPSSVGAKPLQAAGAPNYRAQNSNLTWSQSARCPLCFLMRALHFPAMVGLSCSQGSEPRRTRAGGRPIDRPRNRYRGDLVDRACSSTDRHRDGRADARVIQGGSDLMKLGPTAGSNTFAAYSHGVSLAPAA